VGPVEDADRPGDGSDDHGGWGMTGESTREPASTWTFLTNHAHVLLAIAADPDLRLRDVAERIGITERATQRIVAELEAEGYLEVRRVGRRNAYRVHAELPLRHPAERHHRVGELLEVLSHEQGGRRANE
jgi:DNA-binding MarR family transcriptional regulator